NREPKSRNYLSLDQQEIRYVGHADHLATMKRLGATAPIIVVHGVEDTTCPFAEAREMVFWMRRARLDVVPHFITKQNLDSKVFKNTGHSLGDRTKIVFQVAGKYLEPGGRDARVRAGKCDFERRDE